MCTCHAPGLKHVPYLYCLAPQKGGRVLGQRTKSPTCSIVVVIHLVDRSNLEKDMCGQTLVRFMVTDAE